MKYQCEVCKRWLPVRYDDEGDPVEEAIDVCPECAVGAQGMIAAARAKGG